MGIPGLSTALRRYGKFSSLGGQSVVIDGPSLVYQILHGCILKGPEINGFLCHPSYSTIGRKVVGWLEDLQRYNVTVRKIYFDGYLPPSKWPIRQQRLMQQSEIIRALLIAYPHGCPGIPEDAFEAIESNILLTHHGGDAQAHHVRWLPKPSFLVPAVTEILKSCPTWGPLVEVVSGEADMFCADDVRRHGGVLLTGDSDLLVSELGPNGSMSFFGDVVRADKSGDSQELLACKYSLHAVNDQLGLSNVGGWLRVAFEKMKREISFDEAISRAKRDVGGTLKSSAYRDFAEEYSMKEYLPKDHPVQKVLSILDPRISEIIIQALLLGGLGSVPNARSNENPRGPGTLAMFLPIMIEDRNRKSAWTMSAGVRELAYGIIQTFTARGSPAVIEYRLLRERSAHVGRQIDVPGSDETLEQCRLLAKILKQLTERIRGADMKWLAFTLYQDISCEGPVHLAALLSDKTKHKSSNEDVYSWDTIHFAAKIQASLYSLRMVKQILDVTAWLGTPLPSPMQELREYLSALPTIAEWPTVNNISQALATANEAGVVSTVLEILGIPGTLKDFRPSPPTTPTQPTKQHARKIPSKNKRDPKRPRSVNPYAALSDSSRS
ncbi:hypothetical protein F5Y14DRAFT_418133 [Nemania sp. NC0429]|nr:hypothetical protein F5Y14DRAFT_418133 [Nemania sp. NC0429]